MDQKNFMTWKGNCRVCGTTRKNGLGVFCANFLTSKGGFLPCANVWCGECYKTAPDDPFPVQETIEEDLDLELDPVDETMYRRARNGDHLMGVPFECDLCHFRNLTRRNPRWGEQQDEYTLTCVRRANLDAMWARATSTVRANLGRIRLDYRSARQVFSIYEPLPLLGWEKLEDRVGMGVAIMTLHSSLRPGKYCRHLQFDSMRKTPTWYGHLHRGGTEYSRLTLFAQDERKVKTSTCPTDGEWFQRFKLGAKLRMGQIRKQNEAFTSGLILALDKVAEELWEASISEVDKEEIEATMTFVITTFCAALRQEEVSLLSLTRLLTFWEETTTQEKSPHILLTLHGRFKGETGVRWHCVPIALTTRSNLPVGKWIARLIKRRVFSQGKLTGWLFGDSTGSRIKFGRYDPCLIDLLERVKVHFPEHIHKVTEPGDFSLWRSGRRGAITEAANQKVDQQIIELMGRWRQREAARGTEPGLPMRQVYTQMRSVFPAMISFSSSF